MQGVQDLFHFRRTRSQTTTHQLNLECHAINHWLDINNELGVVTGIDTIADLVIEGGIIAKLVAWSASIVACSRARLMKVRQELQLACINIPLAECQPAIHQSLCHCLPFTLSILVLEQAIGWQ
ncbi:hypothetical protein D3C73_971680 [compost metagenome]